MEKLIMSSSMSLCQGLILSDTSDDEENTVNQNESDDEEDIEEES